MADGGLSAGHGEVLEVGFSPERPKISHQKLSSPKGSVSSITQAVEG